MRDLTVTDKRKAVLALLETSAPENPEVTALTTKVDYLKSILRNLLIRTRTERQNEVKNAIQELDRIVSPMQLQIFVDSYYNSAYFVSEPDLDFKVELATALQAYMRLRIPSYDNEMFRLVSERSLDAGNLLRNFIEE